MTHAQFDYWVTILKTHFPDHPILRELGRSFFPRTPEEVAIRQEAERRAHPVVEMRDQDGARRHNPDFHVAAEWLEVMVPGDVLVFVRWDGAQLRITEGQDESFGAGYLDVSGRTILKPPALDEQHMRTAIRQYLDGDTPDRQSQNMPKSRAFVSLLKRLINR